MAKRRSRVPNRQATRKGPALRVVGPDGPAQRGGGAAGEVKFGADADIADALVAIAREAVGAVGKARTALAAELAVAGLLGMADQAAPPDATREDRDAARDGLLGELIAWAVADASPAALAFLRVAAVLGDASTREPASAAADLLAANGVQDRRWAALIGRPRLLRAWWYGDIFGNQESVNLLFDYAHREHAVCVLIDHGLGGGVKDCWITEGRDAAGLRTRMAAEMAGNPVSEFDDIDPARAVEILQAALAQPACPVQDDQIQDVADNLEVLRARVRLLMTEPDQGR
jgi:hypothetical protein